VELSSQNVLKIGKEEWLVEWECANILPSSFKIVLWFLRWCWMFFNCFFSAVVYYLWSQNPQSTVLLPLRQQQSTLSVADKSLLSRSDNRNEALHNTTKTTRYVRLGLRCMMQFILPWGKVTYFLQKYNMMQSIGSHPYNAIFYSCGLPARFLC
jgi:hypothetical protein